MLEYERSLICEKGTNKFNWKKAKVYINDEFILKLINYAVMGPKPGEYIGYKTLNFIEKNIEALN